MLVRIAIRKVRCISLAALLICVLKYFHIGRIFFDQIDHDIFTGHFFVNTSGCRMLAMQPFSKKALENLYMGEDRACNGSQLFRSETVGGKNYLIQSMSDREITKAYNIQRITELSCKYASSRRIVDNMSQDQYNITFRLRRQSPLIQVEAGPRVVHIYCFVNKTRIVYHDVHFFLPCLQAKPKSFSNPNRLSVMILGIDSVSHLHFIRSMTKTAAFIKEQPHVEFWGYNRVGLNSYPNIAPMLTGLNVDELEATCYREKLYFDKCTFLWNRFKDAGFNTSFGEDTCGLGTFTYFRKGFEHQPTDFYLRPTMLEADFYSRYSFDERDLIFCTAGRKFGEVLHEFIYKLIPHMMRGPHFSFFWETEGVHNYFNYARLLDKKYLSLFKEFHSSGILNNTLVLLLADHGLRFGSYRNSFQGMLEESAPLLIALYPKWLEAEYPMAISNLHNNAHSLVTAYDIHATLKDMTNLELLRDANIASRMQMLKELGSKMPRGINLFLPIPDERDCELAGIPSHFCLCHNLQHIPTNDKRSRIASNFVVGSINMLIKNFPLCQRLRLYEVLQSYVLFEHGKKCMFEVKVRVRTMPGEGLFEGTVRIQDASMALSGAITRINRYGNQSYCVHNYHIEMYCYCL